MEVGDETVAAGDIRMGSAIDNCGEPVNGEMLLKLDMKMLFSSDEER